ncbi:Glia maturation factor beta [Varanus komodoensis]|nr:Glia maturation factor beta [Varanus komodoensis]
MVSRGVRSLRSLAHVGPNLLANIVPDAIEGLQGLKQVVVRQLGVRLLRQEKNLAGIFVLSHPYKEKKGVVVIAFCKGTELAKRIRVGMIRERWKWFLATSVSDLLLLSESLVVCDVAEDLVEKLRKFRFRKETNNAAIIMKIDKDKQLVVLDEEHEPQPVLFLLLNHDQGISPDELKDELPERQPRYPSHSGAVPVFRPCLNREKTFIVYSYKYQHDDGRVSYPLCFIFSSPVGCKPEQQMMYAGSKNKLVQTAELTKLAHNSRAGENSMWSKFARIL